MKTYTITLTKEQIEQLGLPTEVEYPLIKRNRRSGSIVKFTDLTTGEVLWQGDGKKPVGFKSSNIFHLCTDTKYWEDVLYNRERNLYHGQMVECLDTDEYSRQSKFYDAINDCTFSYNLL